MATQPAQSNTRPTRAQETLELAANDAAYEVEMLASIVAIWPLLPLLHTSFRNMAVESCLLHYRNVRDFLYPTPKTKHPNPKDRGYAKAIDDVIAFDFNPSGWNSDSRNRWRVWTRLVPEDKVEKMLFKLLRDDRVYYDPITRRYSRRV